ncbi:hypothetical protein BH09BAC2_BH09BAC2_21430 [soil metagenome]
MKKILIAFLMFAAVSVADAQILNPAKFDYSVKKKSADLYEVHIKAIIEPGWHLYSVTNPEGGAQATIIKFTEGKATGSIKEAGKLKTVYDKQFKVNQKYFEKTVDFVQLVKIKSGKKIAGTIEYMLCNDNKCLPPKEIEFKIKM